jgi:fermentation-respiration switch protein FrsA (DUF1100 family)
MTEQSASRSWSALCRLWRFFRFFALTYLGILLMLMLLENKLVYHPTSASQDWISPALNVQDVELTTADGTRIHAWWCPHPGSTGTMLYCHGNAGNLSYRQGAIHEWQEQLGESVLIFDYPGFGRSEGSPTEAGCYAAAQAAFDWLTQSQGIAAENVILYGKSLGGGVAVELATRRPHRALVLAKTFTSLPDMAQKLYPWLPARWLTRTQFNNLEKITTCTRPVFITHGNRDTLIPFTMGQRLYEAAPGPKHFLPLPGGGHDDLLPPAFFTELKRFLAEVEKPSAAN